MANGKTRTARRREVRRNMPRSAPRWARFPRRRQAAWAVGYAAALALLATLIALPVMTDRRYRYQMDQRVTEPVVSRVPFEAVDPEASEEQREQARDSEPQLYVANREYLTTLREQFDGLMALADYQTVEEIPSHYREQVNLTREGLAALQSYKQADGEGERSLEQWNALAERFRRELFDQAILRRPPRGAGHIAIRHPDPGPGEEQEQVRYGNVLYSLDDPAVRGIVRREATPFPTELRETIVAMVMQRLQPTYVFNTEAQRITADRRDAAAEAVEPVLTRHDANSVLIPAGAKLDGNDLDLLDAEQRAFEAQQSTTERWLHHAGLATMMIALAAGLWLYIFNYNHRIARNPLRGLAITGLLVLCQALAVGLTQLYPGVLYLTAIFPTLLAAIVLTIAYDQRFALAVGALHAAIVMVSLQLPISFALVLMTGVGVAVMLLREVRNRSSIVLVGAWSGAAMGAVTLLVAFTERSMHLDGVLQRIGLDSLFALLTGVFTGLLVQGVLPAIERIFKVNTAMTLKELNDASHPLLQRLAQEAPGTYQHSLRIADMAESAAEAIGGDGLLCRVGAMYHDVGKINKPGYFIENQAGGPNRHAKLSPAMSLLIIVGHVKDGIEMAREYRLPQTIRHFIESHHGTTLVEYFYHAARKQKEAEAAPGPSEFEFRYAGPKPQTREAAILLLCDSIEAAARSLAEPTPVRLEQIVHNIAMKRLMDGQFDESNLTLKELHRIEAAITKTLCAIYHARITYPEDQRQPAAAPAPPAPGERPRLPQSAAS
ncbi:MAG: HD family phosphohydrolase [Phycisphaeraceae bacterium]